MNKWRVGCVRKRENKQTVISMCIQIWSQLLNKQNSENLSLWWWWSERCWPDWNPVCSWQIYGDYRWMASSLKWWRLSDQGQTPQLSLWNPRRLCGKRKGTRFKNESLTCGSRNASLTINSFILQDEPCNGTVTFQPGCPDQRKCVVFDLH